MHLEDGSLVQRGDGPNLCRGEVNGIGRETGDGIALSAALELSDVEVSALPARTKAGLRTQSPGELTVHDSTLRGNCKGAVLALADKLYTAASSPKGEGG